MKVSRKLIESIAVAGLALALTITSITTSGQSVAGRRDTVELAQNGIAGITAAFGEYLKSDPKEPNLTIGVDQEIAEMVTASARKPAETVSNEKLIVEEPIGMDEPTGEGSEGPAEGDSEESAAEPVLTAEEEEWLDKIMPDVKEFLNIREKADQDSKVVGKLRKGDRALVKEQGSEWTLIASGNVTGYVKSDYCLYGLDALAYARATCDVAAQATVDGLRVRSEASVESRAVKMLDKGESLIVDADADAQEGWVAVKYASKTCYVSADYVQLKLQTGKAITIEEEKKSAQVVGTNWVQNAEMAADVDEETLLAALIDCEAGSSTLECMTAVGAVVLNRVRSRSFPNSIRGVIYQSGQFAPVRSGGLARRLERGPSASAKRAARAALAGDDPTGGALYFRMASGGHAGLVIGSEVFY